MKNKAKCKLCNEIIESFHRFDFVSCKCGEISVDGGQDFFYASAKDYKNFLRIDEEGNEIEVKVIEKDQEPEEIPITKPSKKELIEMLDMMGKSIERIPPQAMISPINHYDFLHLILILTAILKED